MGQLEDILKHQNVVRNNIMKSFGAETSEDSLEKSFEDEVNPFEMEAYKSELTKAELDEFEKAKHQDGDMHPNGKWVWRQSANGGKGDWRVAKTGGKSTDGGASANADTTSKPKGKSKSTSDFDSLSSAKTQLEVNKFWENLLTSNSGKGKNLAGKLLDSMKEYGYNNVSGAMTTRGVNTFKFANKDADKNITMVTYQDGLVIKTNDKKEILKVSDFKTISDFKKKFDETVLKLAGKDNDAKKTTSKKTDRSIYGANGYMSKEFLSYLEKNKDKIWPRTDWSSYTNITVHHYGSKDSNYVAITGTNKRGVSVQIDDAYITGEGTNAGSHRVLKNPAIKKIVENYKNGK